MPLPIFFNIFPQGSHRNCAIWKCSTRLILVNFCFLTSSKNSLQHSANLILLQFVVGSAHFGPDWLDYYLTRGLNSLASADAIGRVRSLSNLVEIMTCRLFGVKPLSELVLSSGIILGPKFSENLNRNWIIVIHENSFKIHPPSARHFVQVSMCCHWPLCDIYTVAPVYSLHSEITPWSISISILNYSCLCQSNTVDMVDITEQNDTIGACL